MRCFDESLDAIDWGGTLATDDDVTLEGLWEHLTMGERSRLMSQLVASIDHDPTDSTLSITLSPLGLKSFATKNPNNEETKKS